MVSINNFFHSINQSFIQSTNQSFYQTINNSINGGDVYFFKPPFLKKIHLGSVSSLGPEIKKSEPTEVPYLISPNGDIKDLTSYSNPRVSDEYAYKSRTGNTFTY